MTVKQAKLHHCVTESLQDPAEFPEPTIYLRIRGINIVFCKIDHNFGRGNNFDPTSTWWSDFGLRKRSEKRDIEFSVEVNSAQDLPKLPKLPLWAA